MSYLGDFWIWHQNGTLHWACNISHKMHNMRNDKNKRKSTNLGDHAASSIPHAAYQRPHDLWTVLNWAFLMGLLEECIFLMGLLEEHVFLKSHAIFRWILLFMGGPHLPPWSPLLPLLPLLNYILRKTINITFVIGFSVYV